MEDPYLTAKKAKDITQSNVEVSSKEKSEDYLDDNLNNASQKQLSSNMMSEQQRIFVKRLFEPQTSKMNIDQYLSFLEDRGKLRYFTCNQFCQRILSIIQQQGYQFSIYLKNEFTIKWQHDQNKGIAYHFPLIIHRNQMFEKANVLRFVTQYLRDQTEDQIYGKTVKKERKYSDKKLKLSKSNDALEEQNRLWDFDDEGSFPKIKQGLKNKEMQGASEKKNIRQKFMKHVERMQQQNQKKLSGQQKTQGKNQKAQKYTYTYRDATLAIEDTLQNPLKVIIPTFFKEKKKSFETLIGIEITMFFDQELRQVKEMLHQQVEKRTIIQYYSDFFTQYLHFRAIIDGQCQQNISKQRRQEIKRQLDLIENRYSQIKQDKQIHDIQAKSILIEAWSLIFQQLNNKHDQEKFDTINQIPIIQKIAKYLKKGIENVFLVFNYHSPQIRLYGCTKGMTISINLNYAPKELTFKQYQDYLIKPYIALIMYHQLAHFIVRQYNIEKNNISGASFNIESESIGDKILKIVKNYYPSIPNYLLLIQDTSAVIKFTTDPSFMNEIANNALKFYTFNKQFLSKIKQRQYQIQQIIRKLQKISNMVHRFSTKIKKTLNKIQWDILKKYIEKIIQRKTGQQCHVFTKIKYELFFAVFLTPEIMKMTIKNFACIKQEYELLCKNLMTSNISGYFIDEQKVIVNFSQSILPSSNKFVQISQNQNYKPQSKQQSQNQLRQLKQIKNFIYLTLQQGMTSQKINQKINSLIQNLSSQSLSQYIKKFQEFVSHSQLVAYFPQFKLTTFNQLNEHKNIVKIVKNAMYLENIIAAFQSSKIIKNLINYSELLCVSYQSPSFFIQGGSFRQKKDYKEKLSARSYLFNDQLVQQRCLQAGYDLQRRLFPSFVKDQILYAKDYELIKRIHIQECRLSIGKKPENPSQIIKNMPVKRGGKSIVSGGPIQCGLRRNLAVCGTNPLKRVRRRIQKGQFERKNLENIENKL